MFVVPDVSAIVTKGFGKAFTVINLDVLAVQPKAEVTVTVKVPVVDTEILVVVAPVLHR
ncbi:MAG: hypothetical protein IPN46_10205 [Saprospiraceae bacterium]|nr:hypothetical protein [Saprospiraceae bacterium]